MKKYIFTLSFLTILFSGFSQKHWGVLYNDERNIVTETKSKVNFEADNYFKYSLLSQDKVQGISKGWKVIPFLPFLGNKPWVAGLVQKPSEKSVAIADALSKTQGASFLVDLEYEKTYRSFLWIFWIEKTIVSGYPARIENKNDEEINLEESLIDDHNSSSDNVSTVPSNSETNFKLGQTVYFKKDGNLIKAKIVLIDDFGVKVEYFSSEMNKTKKKYLFFEKVLVEKP